MTDNEDRVGSVFLFVLIMASERHAVSNHADAEGQNYIATVFEENDDLDLPTQGTDPKVKCGNILDFRN